ncbi:TaqI-like C-terminal specificity domain-containing protein [Mucilaginibacter antarcticus]|uniref:site-specific DNA-methyltransferase (adenine-specific) n=2 Tax=Mucilaginibacter antarcticus TaxID=1855725 RepID=A0ABW5XPP1_9SPHI
METIGVPLKDWDINIYRGILTGYNDAFIIDTSKKDELVSQSGGEDLSNIIKPILRGRDVDRYKTNWQELYLIYIPWHFPLHKDSSISGASKEAEIQFQIQYPAIYNHLLNFKTQLSNRNKAETGIRYEWYALQRWGANYMDDFFKQKIIWKRIGSVIRFSYDESGLFCLDSTCFATGSDMKFLVGYLNSTVSRRELLRNSPQTGTGDVITSVQALEPLLIPKASEEAKYEISRLVDLYLTAISNNLIDEAIDVDCRINLLFFELFDLSVEEIAYISNS